LRSKPDPKSASRFGNKGAGAVDGPIARGPRVAPVAQLLDADARIWAALLQQGPDVIARTGPTEALSML